MLVGEETGEQVPRTGEYAVGMLSFTGGNKNAQGTRIANA